MFENISKLIFFSFIFGCTHQAIFEEINSVNRGLYAKSKELAFENVTYLMINGDSPYLYINGTLADYRLSMTKNTTYEILKEISHLSLAILSEYGNRCGRPLSFEQKRDFDLLKAKMYSMFNQIYIDPLIPDELKSEEAKFVNMSIKIVEATLNQEKFDCKQLKMYADSIRPILDKNLYAAALSQLTDMNDLIKSWIRKYDFINWESIYLLICNAHMPKEKHVFVQYFERLISIGIEGDKLIYAETMDENLCIDLFKTHLIDKQVAINLFNDPMKLHKELLGEASEVILNEMIKEPIKKKEENQNLKIFNFMSKFINYLKKFF